MAKKITKYGEDDYRIEEEKTETVVSTANIKVLEEEIKRLDRDIDELTERRSEKKKLLKELKAVK